MPSTPYFKWFPGDYLNDTQTLSDEADLLYRRLLDSLWMNGGYLPRDDVALARVSRFHLRKFRRTFDEVSSKFSRKMIGEKPVIYHPKLLEQYEEAQRIQGLRREAGKARAAAHAGGDKPANAAQPDPYTVNNTQENTDTKDARAKRRPPEKSQIDKDSKPSAGVEAYCREKGYPRPELWWSRFIETFLKNGTRHKDWELTAKVWIREESPAGKFHHPATWEKWLAKEKQLQGDEAKRTMGEMQQQTAKPPSLEDRKVTNTQRTEPTYSTPQKAHDVLSGLQQRLVSGD